MVGRKLSCGLHLRLGTGSSSIQAGVPVHEGLPWQAGAADGYRRTYPSKMAQWCSGGSLVYLKIPADIWETENRLPCLGRS